MNRIATTTRRSSRQPSVAVPEIVATLDLADEGQRRSHDLIRRFHTGRWPRFRCLGMRQIDGQIVEAVEWLRMARPSFSVVWWQSDGLGLSWKKQPSSQSALARLRNL